MDLLLTEDWDLLVDRDGNIGVTGTYGYSRAQTVANEIKLFLGEGWYDRSQGTPHFAKVLGINTNLGLVRNILLDRANGVDGIRHADIDLYVDEDRVLHGDIYLKSQDGEVLRVEY
ncbi:hypothetical protein [Commensalibacter oyaizuii]|uniref:Uncharacterized protein n=1 Tax=Commensalibacter oyaizuii TaxID=3043873 RepID=A0ABT6Q3K7_9PROT|nr:hypothetical protein [Commensalibacter sp. TBRC 16381]MDI2091695.1 hypothetical protein [Commensalibacter sp. TBRC 16381]